MKARLHHFFGLFSGVFLKNTYVSKDPVRKITISRRRTGVSE